jgi:hypothetical protein
MNWLKQLFCSHDLYIRRTHKNCVSKSEKRELFYVDDHGVYCFIACQKCGKIFRACQPEHEKIFGEMK